MKYLSKEYLEEERTPKLLVIAISFYVLSFLLVILRLASRRIVKAKLWWDDVLIIFALIVLSVPLVTSYYGANAGAGRHIEAVQLQNFRILQLTSYIGELVYPIVLTSTKCSILVLYIRLFGLKERFATVVKYFIGLAVAWGIATLFPVMLQCIPVYKTWELFAPNRHCLSLKAYFLATNTVEVVIDFGMLILPIPQVWALKLSKKRKTGICAIFILGAFTSVVGVVRLIVVAQLDDRNDITWNYIPAANWSLIEMNTGIMCACMPATAPAIKRVFQHWRGQSMAKISFVNADMPQGLSSGGDTVTLASLVHKSNTDLSPA